MTGSEVRSIREAMGLSQSALGAELGLSRWSIARYEIAGEVPRLVELAVAYIGNIALPARRPEAPAFSGSPRS